METDSSSEGQTLGTSVKKKFLTKNLLGAFVSLTARQLDGDRQFEGQTLDSSVRKKKFQKKFTVRGEG